MLQPGAETIVNQCLRVEHDEHVVIPDDGNDQDLVDAILASVADTAGAYDHITYDEPATHGEEPPDRVAEAMRESDVFIAPTSKSISHTDARREACEAGARGATLPGITKEIWETSLQADYTRVKEITDEVFDLLSAAETIHITTPSGTDLTLEYDIDHFHKDTGLIRKPGDFGNLPAGEADGGISDAQGTLVIDHFPFAPAGTQVTIEDRRIVAVDHPGSQTSDLAEAVEDVDGAESVAEFGFGTNPSATLIGNVLQDEKVLGTVHVAFGDNSSYLTPEEPQYTNCEIHWDTVCESPTVYFGDELVLDEGEPTFLDSPV